MRISDWSSDVCSSDLTAGLLANSPNSQPNASSDSSTVSSGLYSSHSPGRVRGGSAGACSPDTSMNSRAVRAASPVGAVNQATASDTVIRIAVSTIDCHRKIVSENGRSEEHTSELQSLMRISYAVFCLKKKKQKKTQTKK